MAKLSDEEQTALIYDRVKQVRASKTLELKPSPRLRQEILGMDGQPQPFRMRYYQSQGIFHLLTVNRMVLGDGTGLGKCEPADTLIISSEGQIPIRSLAPKEFDSNSAEGFYSLDRPLAVWTGRRMATVPRFYWGGRKPTVQVTTRNNYRIEGTLVHPLLVRSAKGHVWEEAGALQVGDHLCVERKEAPFPEVEPEVNFVPKLPHGCTKIYRYQRHLSEDLASLIGYVVGEGNRAPYGICVTQCSTLNPETHQEIRDLFFKVFGWSGNENCGQRDIRINVSSVGIKEYLAACGVGEELSRTKFVPDLILRGTRSSVRGFLSAMFEGEGSVEVDAGGVEFSSASEQLIRTIQVLLLRFGVVSTLSPKLVLSNPHTYWRLCFFGDDARTFQASIGFRSSRKKDLLRDAIKKASNPNKDVVPFSGPMVQSLKTLVLKATSQNLVNRNQKGWGIKQFGESFQSTLKHVINKKRNPTYQWLGKLLDISRGLGLSTTEEYLEVLGVYERRFFYDPIVKVEYGEADVMDIEVEDPDHCYVANGLMSHNTIQVLGAFCYTWDRDPQMKVIVVCPKSAIRQWGAEVEKFTVGVKTFVATGTVAQRKATYAAWEAETESRAILVMNYHTLVRDWDQDIQKVAPPPGAKHGTQPTLGLGLLDGMTSRIPKIIVCFDECVAFKNPSTKTHKVCKALSVKSSKVWGLTATLLKNNLMEGFGIYQVIRPGTFKSKTAFLEAYCVTEMQRVKGGIKVPIVVGYHNLVHFRDTIDPFFYGRPKHVVSNELPTLTTREILCELSPQEDAKYQEALAGLLELGDGDQKDYRETRELTSLIYTQEVVNSLALLNFEEGDTQFEGKSAKEQALLDLLTEEFDGEKVIVYTRFEKLVGRLQKLLTAEKIKSVRITGKEKDTERKKAQDKFQDLTSDVSVVFITDAGSEAINLQAACGMVFFDSPWSWGQYVQLLGRMIRIGSTHQSVLAIHLVAERHGKTSKKETIDHQVIKKLRKKKGLSDQILGEAAVGALKFDRSETDLRDLYSAVQGAK